MPRTILMPGNYMFKVNNRNTRTRYEIFSRLTIKAPGRRLDDDGRESFYKTW